MMAYIMSVLEITMSRLSSGLSEGPAALATHLFMAELLPCELEDVAKVLFTIIPHHTSKKRKNSGEKSATSISRTPGGRQPDGDRASPHEVATIASYPTQAVKFKILKSGCPARSIP